MTYDNEMLEQVVDSIEEWKTKLYKTEKEYENNLYDYLHREFPKDQITKQFSRGRIKADLAIDDEVIIELKNNLKSTSQYQRLIGQLQEYKTWDGFIVLILCGKTEPNLKKSIYQYINDNFSDDEIKCVVKPDEMRDEIDEEFNKSTISIVALAIIGLILWALFGGS